MEHLFSAEGVDFEPGFFGLKGLWEAHAVEAVAGDFSFDQGEREEDGEGSGEEPA